MRKLLVFAAVMVMLPPVYAAAAARDQVVEKPLMAQTLDSFNQESAKIREQMQPGGLYEFIKSADRTRVEACLGDMQRLLQNHAPASELPQRDKVALVNAQEEVNGILRHNDNNRLVCESRAPIGSHIPVTTCRTYGEVEQARADSVKNVSDMGNLSRTSVTPTTRGGH